MSNQNIGPALEKGVYTAFRQKQISSFRQANIGSKLITLDDLQLPTNSVLHLVDQFLSPDVTTVLPDTNNPFIRNEQSPIYLDTLLTIPGKTAQFPIDEKYQFRPTRFNQEIRNFWTTHRNIKRPSSRDAMLHRANTLPIINYNAILTVKILGGTFAYYRHFDVVFRTILNTMVPIIGKYQWLMLPLSPTVYRKTQFSQTTDTISYMTVRVKNDPSFFFLIHLINFVSKTATASLFKKIPDEALDTFNIVLTAGDKAVIYNLGDLKHFRDARQDDNLWQIVLRHVSTLKLAGYAGHDISDLDEPSYDKLVDTMAPEEEPMDDHSKKTDTPTTAVKTPETPTTPTKAPEEPSIKPTSHQTTQKTNDKTHEKPHQNHPEIEPTRYDTETSKTEKIDPLAPSEPSESILHPTPVVLPLSPDSLVAEIDHKAYATILAATHLTEDQRAAAMKVAGVYKTLLIDGVPIIEHLSQSADPPVSNTRLTFLEGKIPDSSMLNSTATNLDKHYIEHVMSRHIAAVVASMVSSGMFLVQVEQRDQISELDRIRHYKIVYQDLTGRRHSMMFKFPIVTSDGTMMVQGIERRMIKQQVNLPICKIDSRRVSLASNYNKTLVERIGTKAHNFSAYMSRYIAQVYKEKVGLVLSYGDLTTDARLPYDYSSLARHYSALTFSGPKVNSYDSTYQFLFDYPKRFEGLGYTEIDSSFTLYGGVYDLTGLLTEAVKLPLETFQVDDLKWVLEYAQTDSERLENADIHAPILVTKDKENRLVTIDGFHRLTKAVITNIPVLQGRLVPEDMLERHRVGDDPGPSGENLKSKESDNDLSTYHSLEKKYGVYCGTANLNGYEYKLFFGSDNQVRFIGPNKGMTPVHDGFTTPFMTLFVSVFEDKVAPPPALSEWTELRILDKNFPVVFILGFEYGLKRVIDHIKLDYKFLPSGTRVPRSFTTIVVPFSDGNLVFDRYPLNKSFVMSGLLKFNTKPYTFESFNTPDIYYTLLTDSQISLNYLKGISDFFTLFIDPITRDVLLRMHEPIDVGRLLLRATDMLTTEDALPTASMRNHRLRGYERFATTLYNEMARTYATYSRQRGNRKSFSINPEAVFLRLIQDQTLHIVEEINPVENIKDKHAATYTGGGGRTAQSFVIADRQFPEDGVGVLSEATPDSGKVSINTYITADPLIADVYGMYNLNNVNVEKLQPSQILSVPSLLMPGSTNDDGKRAAMISIQLKHHVPSEYSETMRIRTGYEAVVAHRTGENFACTAKRDGVVESIDEDLGMIRVKYTSVKPPELDLSHVATSLTIRNKFVEIAKRELAAHNPIYVVQTDDARSVFHLHDLYMFNGSILKVTDVIPLQNADSIPMGDYLTEDARKLIKEAKHPVLIKLITITHNPADDVDIFKFGTKFTSAAGSFVKQNIVCNVQQGEHIEQGDVLAYNTGFFEKDPFDPKQVTWKHGIMANVVLMEANDTIEDSDAITVEFSRRLGAASTHLRTLKIEANTIVRDIRKVGDEVQTTDLLCTLEDAEISEATDSDDHAILDMLTSLNRKAPRARYHGVICEIDALYACPISDMHPSLAAVVKQINRRKQALATAAKGTHKASSFAEPAQVPIGTKYHGLEFDKDTVLLMFYISEEIGHNAGDKLVVGNQAKSVTATVIEKPISTVSGVRVDLLFSGRSVNNRVILSPLICGFTNRILEKLEKTALDLYFG